MDRLTEWTGYEWIAKQERVNGKYITDRDVYIKLAEYEDMGTIDEFAELKELQTSKKPSVVGMQNKCPNIDCFESVLRYYNHCSGCGQKIDWNKN